MSAVERKSSIRVLITRPKEDAASLARALQARSIEALVEPMLKVVFHPAPPLNLEDVQALLATSANGVRAFVVRNSDRDLPVLAVGDATARAAVDAGFGSVESASGDVAALVDLVKCRLDPAEGSLLHVAAGTLAGDLGAWLAAAGFRYRREVLYETVTAGRFSTDTAQAIRERTIDGVVLYSPRTATAFVDLVTKAGLGDACGQMTAWCLSEAVAVQARAIAWRQVIVAARPDEKAMIDAVAAAAATGNTA